MRVLVTGVSGFKKTEYIQKVAESARKTHSAAVDVHDVGETIFKVLSQQNIRIPRHRILDYDHLADARQLAFARILASIHSNETKKRPTPLSIVVSHACFRWNTYLMPGFDPCDVKRLAPSVFVNLQHDLAPIMENLSRSRQWKDRLTATELAFWRDEEMVLTEMLARFAKRPFYLAAVREPPSTLADVLVRPRKKRIYASYPISAILKVKPELLKEAEAMVERLRSRYVVFNPLAVQDLVNPGQFKEDVKDILEQATPQRDFRLIDQSDMVVVYYPVDANSPGVNQEIPFGFGRGKDVFLYYPDEYRISPFWGEAKITKRFGKLDDLYGHLRV